MATFRGGPVFAACVLALALQACGGGGGSSPASGPSGGGTRGALSITKDNASLAGGLPIAVADFTLALSQVALEATQTMAGGSQADIQRSCSNGGVVEYTWTDSNANGALDYGDLVAVNYRDCAVTMLDAVVNGTIRMTLTARASSSLGLDVSFGSGGLQMVDQSDGTHEAVLGSLGVSLTDDGLSRVVTTRSTAADDFRLTTQYSNNGVAATDVEALTGMTLQRTLSREHARAMTRIAFHLDSDILAGSLDVSTPATMSAYFDTFPDEGQFAIVGAHGSAVRLTANFVSDSASATYEFDFNGDAQPEETGLAAWSGFTSGVMWWGQDLGASPQFAKDSARPYASTDFRLLAPAPFTSTMAQGQPIVMQYSRELATNTALHYQLTRGYSSTNSPLWGSAIVGVDVAVKGAYVTITPREPLQHGVQYTLAPTDAGGHTVSSITIADTLGNTVIDYGRTFTVDGSLNAAIATPGSVPLLGHGTSLPLSAVVSSSDGAAIVKYEWTEVGTSNLVFADPAAAQTSVSLAGTAPSSVTLATVQLKITDSHGGIEFARQVIQVIADPSTATLLYLRSDPGDYIGGGRTGLYSSATGVFSDNTTSSNYLYFGYSDGGTFGGAWWYLNFASADGSPLHVGAYENALRAPFRGAANGIDVSGNGAGCNTITGRFDVLDIAYDLTGKVSRLAIDFEQHCEGMQPALWGSMRINSAIAVRP